MTEKGLKTRAGKIPAEVLNFVDTLPQRQSETKIHGPKQLPGFLIPKFQNHFNVDQ